MIVSKVVLVTGGFDPLHSGHIAYFKAAKNLGDHLVVGLNSDEWLTRKKGRPFMSFEERAAIIKELSCVDEVIGFDDSDNTACLAIGQVLQTKAPSWKLVFANGGDRTNTTTPEYKTWGNHPDVSFAFGIGGINKINSSSWILDEWKTQKTKREWGYWRVLDDKQPAQGLKVKELVIYPGHSLSYQKHYHRAEHWYVLSGKLMMNTEYAGKRNSIVLKANETCVIDKEVWHQATNVGSDIVHVIEIQYGEKCEEEDIERSSY